MVNICVEVFFLMELLTCRSASNDVTSVSMLTHIDHVHYFASVDNAVYFAVSVLHHQER